MVFFFSNLGMGGGGTIVPASTGACPDPSQATWYVYTGA